MSVNAIGGALFAAFGIVIARLVLRVRWLAIVVTTLFLSATATYDMSAAMPYALVFPLTSGALLTLLAMRFGLLSLVVAWFTWRLLAAVPMTLQFSHWRAIPSNWTLAMLVGLALFGFYASRAGQPLFGSILAGGEVEAGPRTMIGRRCQSRVVKPLEGRGVLVTGASSGIGRAIALAMARAGADVAVTYRANEHGRANVAREIQALGRRAAFLQLDLADERVDRRVGPAARDALGRLDVWVNNAGADILTGRRRLAVTVRSSTCCCPWICAARCCVVAGRGDSRRAERRRRHHQHELGPRADRHGWHQPAALCGGEGRRARVQQVAGALGGPARARQRARARLDRDRVRRGTRRAIAARGRRVHAAERWGTPDDVAGAAVFLASPAAAFITGQTILVGGGVVM